jgi:hypothetical protein
MKDIIIKVIENPLKSVIIITAAGCTVGRIIDALKGIESPALIKVNVNQTEPKKE